MDPTTTGLPSKRSDTNITPITSKPVKGTDDGGTKSSLEANLNVPEAEISLESSNSRLINNGPTLPLSETNPAESSETKDVEGFQLQNNPANKKQKSSEEEAADTDKSSDQHHLKETRNKKNNINKIKGGAGATTPESPVRSELYEAIEVLENNCATITLKVHPTILRGANAGIMVGCTLSEMVAQLFSRTSIAS